jgi:hypothetical protein
VNVAHTDHELRPTVGSSSSLRRRVALVISGVWAAILGALPHVLHHVGPLAGAAIFAGATGSLLFGAIGFVVAIPFLRRVRRRTGSWRVPAAVLVAMAIAFTVSTLVVGPAISGGDDDNEPAKTDTPSRPADDPDGHDAHH